MEANRRGAAGCARGGGLTVPGWKPSAVAVISWAWPLRSCGASAWHPSDSKRQKATGAEERVSKALEGLRAEGEALTCMRACAVQPDWLGARPVWVGYEVHKERECVPARQVSSGWLSEQPVLVNGLALQQHAVGPPRHLAHNTCNCAGNASRRPKGYGCGCVCDRRGIQVQRQCEVQQRQAGGAHPGGALGRRGSMLGLPLRETYSTAGEI